MQPQKQYIVLTAFGKNQPYLIADICAAVTDSRLNIVAVEQNALHGLFIMFMVTETVEDEDLPQEAYKRLADNTKRLPLDVKVDLVESTTALKTVQKNLQVFTIIGRDKVGILKAITNTLANFRVNIERMHHLARGELVALEMLVDASELRDLAVLKDVIQRTCDEVGFDTIIQPDTPYRQRRRLVVFDMDSTLIEGEIIDELASMANVGEQVSEITDKAMAGKIEFKQALRERVKLLQGLPVSVLEEVASGMRLSPGAYDLVSTLKAMGFKLALISGGFKFFANRLKEHLDLDYVYANDLEIKNGVLSGRVAGRIIDREVKGEIVTELAELEKLSRDEIVAIGDGANDEIMLKNAGLGIAFNASELLKKVADGRLTNSNLLGLLYCLGATEQALQEK
ncbi:phosphoserine phosphatase SerB [candidate division KSB1 bacterium]|nr:phosphoserine phosphatase SerB [candidate division KSB1 bacterium]NIR72132.1 phosphoserine phosphatase SerB [candidate division KSB1 bacterium]NIS26597.1 phosphoserine phosphatase SerB [candidate division KSB1 bacterium]NIT73365.1 phosphoserine phosphatase SerB [candidate division KSB1 bacterium]NIU27213.1 phosphoserine phosphatase SerB [candidate division KSB1 bacterium]